MAKASDNVFPRVIAGLNTTDQAAPSDSSWRIYAKPGGIYARSSNTVVGPFAAASAASTAGTLLAVTAYKPGSDTTVATITSTSGTDCDATNLQVTFTAPASGNVLVKLSCLVTPDNNSPYSHAAYWGLRESSSDIAGPYYLEGEGAQLSKRKTMTFYVSGISAGSHTYKWSGKVAAGGSMTLLAGTTWGQCVMEVFAAP